MGWSGHDDFLNETTVNGKRSSIEFSKVLWTGATSAAGRWHEALSQAGGTGGAMTLTGTAGVGIVMDSTKAGALPLNANVSPDTRHLLSATLITASTTMVPGMALLTDIIHLYPSLVLVTTPSTLSNHPTWTGTGDTRMTNANGVQASVLLTTASSAAGQLTLSYNDEAGNAGTAGPVHSPVASHPAGCFMNATNVSATPGGLLVPLAAGDLGVRQVNSYAINTGATGGTGCIILHRPIGWIPLGVANSPSILDFYTGQPIIPRIYDGACLGLIAKVGGAYAAGGVLEGQFVYGWG
jgi:hypothetical protein